MCSTKRLLNNEYYGGCVHHGSFQPFATSKNKIGNQNTKNKICIRIEREILSDRKKEYITKNYTRKYSSYDKAKNNYYKFKV